MQEIDISKISIHKEKDITKHIVGDRFNELLHKEIYFGSRKLSDKKKQQLYGDLHMLISSGIDLINAFEIISDSYPNAHDKKIIDTIIQRVIEGETLSQAFLKSGLFTPHEYYSIQIGEETANLDKVLSELSRFFTRRIEQRKKLISAFTYPIIVIITAILAVAFMLNFIVPMFEEIYSRFNQDLPELTQYIIKFSHFVPYLIPVFLLLFLMVFAFIKLAGKKPWFIRYRDSLLIKLPVYGPIIKDIQLSRFFSSMELLISSKIPLLQSIVLAKNMIGFYPLNNALGEMEENIIAGKSLNESMSYFPIFTRRVISLIRVGEEVNQLQKTFSILKDIYHNQVEQRLNTISTILEPLMVVFVGLFVALILISMYLPIFKISSNFAF